MYSMSDIHIDVITFRYLRVYIVFMEGETIVKTSRVPEAAFTEEDLVWRMKYKGEATFNQAW